MPALDKYQTCTNVDFRARVKILLIGSAIDIIGENPVGKSELFIKKRHELAVQILNNPDSYIDRFCFAIVSYNSSTLTVNSPDSDIQWTINSLFSDIAGITFAELQAVVNVLQQSKL